MKFAIFSILVLGVVAPAAFSAESSGPVYELRTYTAAPGKLDDLNARFRNHTLKLFEKHGIVNFGYWVPINNTNNQLIYLLGHPDREAAKSSWKAFGSDPEWQKVVKPARPTASSCLASNQFS